MSPSSPPEKGKEDKSKPKENPEESKKWAILINISSPCSDFYKRIPNPAFKVGLLVNIRLFLILLNKCFSDSLRKHQWLPSLGSWTLFLCSSPVAVRAGCFPEAGHTEAGGSRVRVCCRAHISWQNGGGRIRHRSLPEAHDKVCLSARLDFFCKQYVSVCCIVFIESAVNVKTVSIATKSQHIEYW